MRAFVCFAAAQGREGEGRGGKGEQGRPAFLHCLSLHCLCQQARAVLELEREMADVHTRPRPARRGERGTGGETERKGRETDMRIEENGK